MCFEFLSYLMTLNSSSNVLFLASQDPAGDRPGETLAEGVKNSTINS